MSRRVAPCRSIRIAGIEPSLARFAATHASWGTTAVEFEDLLVSLADKIWKAKRVPDLEQLVVDRLAAASGEEPWQESLNLDDHLDKIAVDADHRSPSRTAIPPRPAETCRAGSGSSAPVASRQIRMSGLEGRSPYEPAHAPRLRGSPASFRRHRAVEYREFLIVHPRQLRRHLEGRLLRRTRRRRLPFASDGPPRLCQRRTVTLTRPLASRWARPWPGRSTPSSWTASGAPSVKLRHQPLASGKRTPMLTTWPAWR
ncbi:hypothetical protein [Micromonospora psammae]|uniref:hypothetical protein n=1 Tax=Micromonospora sp. CPCC 205556 TaxID=3122398 RepID=UPI002FEFCB46